MFKRFFILAGLLCLPSCAYVLDEQIQDVTLVTPGAENAVCYMYIDDLRYKIYPPQTLNIVKSHKDMTVDCQAPGNRRRKIVIEPSLSKHEPLNVANGMVPGAAWDFASNSMFSYPDVITVDFTSAQWVPESLPAHNNPDLRQPEDYDLEEFRPGLPRLNSDRGRITHELVRREHGGKGEPAGPYVEGGITPHQGSGKPADKGDLGTVIDGLTTKSAPAGTSRPESAGPPIPLYPGQ